MQVVEELFAGEGLTRSAGEELQQFELVGRQLDRFTLECDRIFFGVDFQSARTEDVRRFDFAFSGTARESNPKAVLTADFAPSRIRVFLITDGVPPNPGTPRRLR